jgi:hypothetical protein
MKSNNNNNDDDDDDDDDDDNNNNTAMGSVHARGDTFLTFGLNALTETNTSRLATAYHIIINVNVNRFIIFIKFLIKERTWYEKQVDWIQLYNQNGHLLCVKVCCLSQLSFLYSLNIY